DALGTDDGADDGKFHSPIVLVFTSSENALVLDRSCKNSWVCDSGATSSATYDADDCVDIVECKVDVTAAGTAFNVERKGTAVILVTDTCGRQQELRITNCLISDKFPYKLLALQAFTTKGHSVLMKEDALYVSN